MRKPRAAGEPARQSEVAPVSAFDRACRALGRRRLSEAEVRRRLEGRHAAAEINRALAKLKEYRFLDDAALIADYASDRLRHSPRSAEMIEAELERRGIEPAAFRAVFAALFSDYVELEVACRALAFERHARKGELARDLAHLSAVLSSSISTSLCRGAPSSSATPR